MVLASARTAAAQVAVVVRAPADGDVALQLRRLIDAPVEQHALSEASAGLIAILEQARTWSAAYVIVLDRVDGAAQVLRLADRTAASRVLSPDVMAESPYAVALAIAELLDWLGAVPPARAPDAAVSPPASDAELEAEPKEAPSPLSAVIGADFEITSSPDPGSPGHDVSLLRPTLSGGLQWGRGLRSPWFGVGARLAAPASTERTLDRSIPDQVAAVRYASIDPSVTVALGLGSGEASLVGEFGVGLSIVAVEARDAAGATLTEDDAVAPWLGLGLSLRYPLLWGLSLAVGAEGQWLVERGRYQVDGTSVLEEGRVRLATRLGIRWESGP